MISKANYVSGYPIRMTIWIIITCILTQLSIYAARKFKKKWDRERRMENRRNLIRSFTFSFSPPPDTEEEATKGDGCSECDGIDNRSTTSSIPGREHSKKTENHEARKNRTADTLSRRSTPGNDRATETIPKATGVEENHPPVREICYDSLCKFKGCTKWHPNPAHHGASLWICTKEPKCLDDQCPKWHIRPGAWLATTIGNKHPLLERKIRCTSAQCCNPDCTRKHWYPRPWITSIPDTGPTKDNKTCEEDKEKKTPPSERRPPTPVPDQESADVCPYLICLDEECKKNHPRLGQKHPQPKTKVEEEKRSEPDDTKEPGTLRPYVLEYAEDGSLQLRDLGDSTNIRKITNGYIESIPNRFSRTKEVSFPNRDNGIGKASPAKKQKLDWREIKKARKRARRAAQIAALESAYDREVYDCRSCRIH